MDTIKTSTSTKKLYQKIFDIQQEVGDIEKATANDFFKSKYAALDSILPVLKPLFAKYKIMFTHVPHGKNLLTLILHDTESEEFIESTVDMGEVGVTVSKDGIKTDNPQKVGSAITYYRRYTLVSILGLNIIGEDDDGNKASGNKASKTTKVEDDDLPF